MALAVTIFIAHTKLLVIVNFCMLTIIFQLKAKLVVRLTILFKKKMKFVKQFILKCNVSIKYI